MILTIHRGNNEIGGSCVELQSGNDVIILDIGLPLIDSAGKDFNFKQYNDLPTEELIKLGVLPNVKGLYKNQKPEVTAVFISHPHQDHYGLLQYIHEDIPVYMSTGTMKLIELTGFFSNIPFLHKNINIIKSNTSIAVGCFNIMPYLVDHSGFDSMAFLLEVENKRIFYTGDFRTHGRKGKVVEAIIKSPPTDINYLLLEGTLIGGTQNTSKAEEDIENDLVKFYKSSSSLKLISFSSQNIDRLVSVYKACVSSGHTLVIDPYTANILDNLKTDKSRIPQFNWNNIKVFFTPNSHTEKLAKSDKLWKYKEAKITLEEIEANSPKLVIKNNYRNTQIFSMRGLLKNAELIYSQWSGYYEKEKDFWEKNNVPVSFIHTSGHAYVNDLKRFAEAINPTYIIPIHTFNPNSYSNIFSRHVIQLVDGKPFNIS